MILGAGLDSFAFRRSDLVRTLRVFEVDEPGTQAWKRDRLDELGMAALKPFTTITILFLALIAILQLVRFIFGWQVTLNGAVVPVWLSGVAFVIAGGLAVLVWRETRH